MLGPLFSQKKHLYLTHRLNIFVAGSSLLFRKCSLKWKIIQTATLDYINRGLLNLYWVVKSSYPSRPVWRPRFILPFNGAIFLTFLTKILELKTKICLNILAVTQVADIYNPYQKAGGWKPRPRWHSRVLVEGKIGPQNGPILLFSMVFLYKV